MSHDTSNNSVFKITFNLFAACIVSGGIIAGVYAFTAKTAEKAAEAIKSETMKELVPSADAFKPVEGKEGWIRAMVSGQTSAIIVPAESKGYGGSIKMLVAVSPDNKVLRYSIIAHNETPGLGDKANYDPFMHEVFGKDVPHLEVTKDPNDKEHVHAIAGATITSRAVTKAVREAIQAVAASGVK
jgi:electron transport complex protein RnfG